MIERPKLKYGSFCSGIEAATAAFGPLGWENVYLGEIEPFPCAVLAYRHGASRPLRMPDPDEVGISDDDAKARRAAIRALDRIAYWGNRVTNFGDMTQIVAEELPYADVLVAGTPCQDFSIAGLRAGLAGNRGNLTLTFVRLVHELVALRRIRAVLWENVPDVLNDKTNAFGAFLGGLLGHHSALRSNLVGGKWGRKGVAVGPLGKVAWSVENTEYYGLAQRRERVFVVASFGEMDPVSVLLERRSLLGNPKPSRQAGEEVASTLTGGARRDGGYSYDDIPLVPGTPRYLGNAEGGATDIPFLTLSNIGKTLNNQTPLVGTPADAPTLYSIMPMNSGKDYKARPVEVAQTLMAGGPSNGAQGGDFVVAPKVAVAYPIDPNALRGDTTAKTATPDAAGRVRLRDPGLGVGEDGDPAPTLQASGPGAVAFSLRGREGGAMPEIDEDGIAPALRAAEGGSSRPYVATFWSVRRLTPVECERLMGFQAQDREVMIRVCRDLSENLRTDALAEMLCPKSQNSAPHADEEGSRLHALNAAKSSITLPQSQDELADLHVLVDYASGAVLIHSREKSVALALNAAAIFESLPLKPAEGFALAAAHISSLMEQATRTGKVVEQSEMLSSVLQNGRAWLCVSGSEIDASVEDATKIMSELDRRFTSTTSDFGLSSQSFDSILRTLSCSALHAIASFIPERMLEASSFDVRVTIRRPDNHTLIPWPTVNRKDRDLEETVLYLIMHGYTPAEAALLAQTPDGPRYKALGNSKGVPLVREIGARMADAWSVAA